ncbi:MAG: 8-oxoguanine DNA glycosylase [Clostridia bacterium]|nr:8-oxoguanine DNA glycosylase [Clostridia bacterium]
MIIDYNAEYFNPEHVLECGQIFRFTPFKEGYFVCSADKACYVHSDGVKTIVKSDDCDYFYNYFDLDRDYSEIVNRAKVHNIPLLTRSCEHFKGLRLLNQNREEMLYSFIISQNNNIPRIKGIISRICGGLGEKREYLGESYYTFPTSSKLAAAGAEFFRSAGCGYRDAFLAETSARVAQEGISHLENLDGNTLKSELLKYKGVGAKVADCVALFGFGKRDSFPVDTWVEKVYKEDFNGTLTDRAKITEYFRSLFGEDAGYVQQYLFYGKRVNL